MHLTTYPGGFAHKASDRLSWRPGPHFVCGDIAHHRSIRRQTRARADLQMVGDADPSAELSASADLHAP